MRCSASRRSLHKLLPIEVAGKLALSLYIALVAALVTKLSRHKDQEEPPWGLLSLFPFAFNQQYFLGIINFCYSLPLLVFALLDQEQLIGETSRGRLRSIGLLLFWQIALLISHLLTFLMYIGFASLRAARAWRTREPLLRAASAPVVGTALFLGCIILEKMTNPTSDLVNVCTALVWKPLGETPSYYCFMFTGMRWRNGVDAGTVVAWLVILVVVVASRLTSGKPRPSFLRILPVYCLTPVVAMLLLPFEMNAHYFVNLRLPSISYFFLALLIGRIRFRGPMATWMVVGVAALVLQSVVKQERISRQLEEILPIIQRIPPNSRIMPLVFDPLSPELEPVWFKPHLHLHHYYQLLRGGISPYFWSALMPPVHLKPDPDLPGPGDHNPDGFNWDRHSDHYQYFLVRGAPFLFLIYMRDWTEPVAQSGEWLLLQRKPVAGDVAPSK